MPGVRATNKTQVAMFLDGDLKDAAMEMAERRGTNLTQLVADLLSEELATEHNKRVAEGRRRAGKKKQAGR